MSSIKPDTTIQEYQKFISDVYGKPNDLHFDFFDMLSNIKGLQ